MKTLLQLLLIFVFCSTYATAQQISMMNDQTDQSSYIFMTLPDTTYIHHFSGEMPDNIIFGNKYQFSPASYFERNPFGNNSFLDMQMDTIEPGVLSEGDLPYKVQYTNDGSRIVVLYHHSNNVVVYDAENLSILADIHIGEGPEGMFLNDERLYVACYYSNDIYVISLDDYSIESHFYVNPHPCFIEVNHWEDIIYVGCDNNEHWKLARLSAYGLSAHNMLWESNSPYIKQMYGTSTGYIGRKVYTLSDFELVGNDQYIACLKVPGRYAMIMDALSGDILKTFGRPDEFFVNVTTTMTKDTVFFQSFNQDSLFFYMVDPYTQQTLDSIMIPMPVYTPAFDGWQDNLAVNHSGNKLFMEVSNFDVMAISVMVDFDTHEYKVFDQGQRGLVFDPMIQSFDKRYAITMGYCQRIFDFELEDFVLYDPNGSIYYNYKVIAPSPVSYEFTWCDYAANRYFTSVKSDEVINVINFDDPGNLVKTDSVICGNQPEADLTYSTAWNIKHEKIITANPLSANISIIDANTYEVDTILEIEGMCTVKQVNDDQVLMGGWDCKYLNLFDIPSLSVIKQFNLNDAHIIIPSPDQQYAYAFSRTDTRLLKIKLDGANSYIEKTLNILDAFSYYLNWEHSYQPEISPDGKYIIMGKEYKAIIIDTETLEVVCDVALTGNYLHDMAFSEDSKRVCFAFWYDVPLFDIMYLDGDHSFLENTVHAADGNGGMSVEFNPIDKKFYIARKNDIWVTDPATGIVEDTIDYDPVDAQVQICIDPHGKPIVNAQRYLYHDGTEYHLKEPTRIMYVDYDIQKCIIPSPGPDRVYIMDFLTTEIHEIPLVKSNDDITVYPNPASDHMTIKSGKIINRLQLFNSNGEMLLDRGYNHSVVTIGLSDYPAGIYFVNVYRGEGVESKKVLIVR